MRCLCYWATHIAQCEHSIVLSERFVLKIPICYQCVCVIDSFFSHWQTFPGFVHFISYIQILMCNNLQPWSWASWHLKTALTMNYSYLNMSSLMWPKCSDADDQLTWTSHDCKRERNQKNFNTCPKLVARVRSYSRANSTPLQAWVFIALPFWTSSTDFCHCLVQAFLSSARTQLTNKKKKLGGSLALGVEGGLGGEKALLKHSEGCTTCPHW